MSMAMPNNGEGTDLKRNESTVDGKSMARELTEIFQLYTVYSRAIVEGQAACNVE